MAKGVKKRSELWWAAYHNRRFDNHVYKQWVQRYNKGKEYKDFRLLLPGDEHATISNLKKAYHSPKTKPEYRAILLHSLFDSVGEWLLESYNQFRSPRNKARQVGLRIRKEKGELYLTLSTEEKATSLSPKLAENIRVKKIHNPIKSGYLKALTTSGIKQQKAAFMLDGAKAALITMIQTITNTIRKTDPFNRFGSPPDVGEEEFDDEDLNDPMKDGDEDKILRRYADIISNVKHQFEGWSLLFKHLGIDTSELMSKWEELETQITDYNTIDHERPDILSMAHDTAQEFAKIGFSYVKQLDKIDWNDPRIDKLPANLAVPTFVTPTIRKSFTRTMSSDDLPEAITEWVRKNSKGRWSLTD